MATNKKITHVGNDAQATETKITTTTRTVDFVASDEAKASAKKLRLFAVLLWIGAVLAQVGAIYFVLKKTADPNFMAWVIGFIVVDLVFAIAGSVLWKKSNQLNPASEKDGFLFFMQNQLGAVVAFIAFLPLIVVILTNKNIDKKQKAILGGIAGVALAIAGISGVDFNPPSIEKNATQVTDTTYTQVPSAAGSNGFVYWTKSGHVYHLYNDCSHINTNKTDEIFEGTIAKAEEEKHITQVCKTCEARAEKDNGFNKTLLNEAEAAPTTLTPNEASGKAAKPATSN